MYTWEIEKYLRERNYVVTKKEFPELVSNVISTQIKDVKFVGNSKYRLITDDGGDFTFTCVI